jgi:hypothetical protein
MRSPDGDKSASELNRELTALLADVGRQFDFDVTLEYQVPGGRLDVVWSWTPPTPMPGVQGPVPVVGFEIESSWRTRKHVKGDLLNLQDAGVALGVIVLAGADARDSLRRFAVTPVDRPGPLVLVWTEQDVRAPASGDADHTVLTEAAGAAASGLQAPSATGPVAAGVEYYGKYRPLWAWLRVQPRQPVELSFKAIESTLGFPLPDSSRAHAAHWHSYEGSAVARAIIDAGWHAEQLRLGDERVTLVPGPPPRSSR